MRSRVVVLVVLCVSVAPTASAQESENEVEAAFLAYQAAVAARDGEQAVHHVVTESLDGFSLATLDSDERDTFVRAEIMYLLPQDLWRVADGRTLFVESVNQGSVSVSVDGAVLVDIAVQPGGRAWASLVSQTYPDVRVDTYFVHEDGAWRFDARTPASYWLAHIHVVEPGGSVAARLEAATGQPFTELQEQTTTNLGRALDQAFAESGALAEIFAADTLANPDGADFATVDESGTNEETASGSGAPPSDPAPAPPCRVEREAPIVTEPLVPDECARVVRRHTRGIRNCYAAQLAEGLAADGRVTVDFVINPDGTVADTSTSLNELEDEALAGCLLAEFVRMRFNDHEAGEPLGVRQTIHFSRSTDE